MSRSTHPSRSPDGSPRLYCRRRREAFTTERVLVVDDSPFQRTVVRDALEGAFAVGGEAADGAEAIGLFEAYEPDAVSMDAVMPEMTGIEAAAAIKEPWPDAVVVTCRSVDQQELVTCRSVDQQEQMMAAVNAGADVGPGKGDRPGNSLRVEGPQDRRERARELLESADLHRIGRHPHSVIVGDHPREISVFEHADGENIIAQLAIGVQRLRVEPVALVLGEPDEIRRLTQVAPEIQLLDVVFGKVGETAEFVARRGPRRAEQLGGVCVVRL